MVNYDRAVLFVFVLKVVMVMTVDSVVSSPHSNLTSRVSSQQPSIPISNQHRRDSPFPSPFSKLKGKAKSNTQTRGKFNSMIENTSSKIREHLKRKIEQGQELNKEKKVDNENQGAKRGKRVLTTIIYDKIDRSGF